MWTPYTYWLDILELDRIMKKSWENCQNFENIILKCRTDFWHFEKIFGTTIPDWLSTYGSQGKIKMFMAQAHLLPKLIDFGECNYIYPLVDYLDLSIAMWQLFLAIWAHGPTSYLGDWAWDLPWVFDTKLSIKMIIVDFSMFWYQC